MGAAEGTRGREVLQGEVDGAKEGARSRIVLAGGAGGLGSTGGEACVCNDSFSPWAYAPWWQ